MKAKLYAMALAAACAAPLRAQDDLESAVRKFAESSNYSFKMETKMESDNDRLGGNTTTKVEGKVDKDSGMTASTDNQDVVRIGKKVVSRAKPEWKIEPEEEDNPGRRGGPRGMGMGFGMPGRFIKPPHEDLGTWSMRNYKKEEKDKVSDAECDVFTAELTDDTCKTVLPFGRFLDRMGGSPDLRGSAKGYVNAEGRLLRVVVDVTCVLSFNGNESQIKVKRTIDLSNFGSTKVEIPDEVKKLLEKGSD